MIPLGTRSSLCVQHVSASPFFKPARPFQAWQQLHGTSRWSGVAHRPAANAVDSATDRPPPCPPLGSRSLCAWVACRAGVCWVSGHRPRHSYAARPHTPQTSVPVHGLCNPIQHGRCRSGNRSSCPLGLPGTGPQQADNTTHTLLPTSDPRECPFVAMPVRRLI